MCKTKILAHIPQWGEGICKSVGDHRTQSVTEKHGWQWQCKDIQVIGSLCHCPSWNETGCVIQCDLVIVALAHYSGHASSSQKCWKPRFPWKLFKPLGFSWKGGFLNRFTHRKLYWGRWRTRGIWSYHNYMFIIFTQLCYITQTKLYSPYTTRRGSWERKRPKPWPIVPHEKKH